jgi:molybdenum cofactor cytidylyltransferase
MTSLGKSSDLRLAVVLLAAGEGSRMGSIPKALLKKGGQSLLALLCTSIKGLSPVEFVVLTGFHAPAIEEELNRLSRSLSISVTIIRNPNPEAGQSSSVRLALESLQSQYDVLAMCLSDQPNITDAELIALLKEFAKRSNAQEIVMPQVREQRGNPVLFSKKVVDEILSNPGMVCRSYMNQHPEQVRILETENEAFILDVDTEADIQSMGITRD